MCVCVCACVGACVRACVCVKIKNNYIFKDLQNVYNFITRYP